MTNSGELIAINGVIVVNDTAENTTNADSYYVAEDTVIASIKINGLAGDVKALYISDSATAVKGGVLITPQSGAYFSGITLTSGSVVVILK
tara:strand:+ start:23 stop:295 length:273 start_codon:yes stop_codon:yes gene_type:complete